MSVRFFSWSRNIRHTTASDTHTHTHTHTHFSISYCEKDSELKLTYFKHIHTYRVQKKKNVDI